VHRVLLVDGQAVDVPVEVAATWGARRRGLLGRDAAPGVLVLRPCRQVHTIGMRFAIDVAFCAPDGVALRTCSMPPGRIARPVSRAQFVLEASLGSFVRWGLERGVHVTVREHAGREQ
jgi:uncharacterized membrane protein (UPF0127 family)